MNTSDDMNAIKDNRDKFYNGISKSVNAFGVSLVDYTKKLSQQTLNISSIVVLHSIFVPQIFAYLMNLTEKTPSIDSVLLVLLALTIMAMNSMIRRDMMAIFVHLIGFITNVVLLSFVVFK